MKFLVDAQLPRWPALWLQQRGHDEIHTLDLAQENRTPDPFLLGSICWSGAGDRCGCGWTGCWGSGAFAKTAQPAGTSSPATSLGTTIR